MLYASIDRNPLLHISIYVVGPITIVCFDLPVGP